MALDDLTDLLSNVLAFVITLGLIALGGFLVITTVGCLVDVLFGDNPNISAEEVIQEATPIEVNETEITNTTTENTTTNETSHWDARRAIWHERAKERLNRG